jgi:hypothetical protein
LLLEEEKDIVFVVFVFVGAVAVAVVVVVISVVLVWEDRVVVVGVVIAGFPERGGAEVVMTAKRYGR